MKTFKTPNGTELPIRDMRGRDYLEVAYRVLWMREEHAEWGIETEFLELSPALAIAKATIKDGQGKIIAQGTKTETPEGFGDFVEKAETGAVGRALALCGYGTQFAQELDEGERIVDGPREPAKRANPPQVGSSQPKPTHATCGKPMMLSKYPNKVTGEYDYYCPACKVSVPKGAA